MKQHFIKKEGNTRLLLFFAGWGADVHLFDRPVHPDYDYLLCYDYRTLHFDSSLLEGYTSIRLMAWSMGVWVASQVLATLKLPFTQKLAINGTIHPIDNEKGIPTAIFDGTLQHFSAPTLAKFRRRMCGTADSVRQFLSYEPTRPLEELKEELAALKELIANLPPTTFTWDKAVIGTADKIFPYTNQQQAWATVPSITLDIEHYDDTLFTECIAGKEEIWTNN